MNIVHNRREKLIETRKLTIQMIKLTARKIVTLTDMQIIIEQQIDFLSRGIREKQVPIEELDAMRKTLQEAIDAGTKD